MNEPTMETLQPHINRTNAKLRFAQIHLDELRIYDNRGSGDPFEESHEESYLFHLFGARDAFLQELNIYYNINLPPNKVTRKNLAEQLKQSSPEFTELMDLEDDQDSWLGIAKEMRDHSTHRHRIAHSYYVGARKMVKLIDPRSGKETELDVISQFESWHLKMETLLTRLRQSAAVRREVEGARGR